MTHKTPRPNVTIPSQRFMWLKMYTSNCDVVCVCFWERCRSSCGCLFVFGLCDPGHWQTAEFWWTPVCCGHERYMVLWTRVHSELRWVRTSACVRQRVGFPHSLAKVWVCIIFPSLLMTFTVSVKCCRFMMPLFRFLWTREVRSDCCWLLHIDNQTHRIVYSILNRSSFGLVFQTVRSTQ